MEAPRRKHIRLKNYDYSQPGAYFVTVCTEGRRELFPIAVGAAPCGRPHPARELAEGWITKLPEKFRGISVPKWVVMPNHVHLLIQIEHPGALGGHMGPPLQEVVGWYKAMTTNQYIQSVKAGELPPFEKRLWQRGYYDHIIRDDNDFLACWTYIDQNPVRWAEDEYAPVSRAEE